MVHVTNGDAVAETIRRWAGEPRLIVWRDMLHEGPVRAGLTLEELSAERYGWLRDNGLGGERNLFEERDRQLRHLAARDSLWLWFEDDLYDQLQLLQVLDFLAGEGLRESPHFLIDMPRELAVERMAALAAAKRRIDAPMFTVARRGWAAFCSADPDAVPALLDTDLEALPHLRAAVERLQEHRPGNHRVEKTIVRLLRQGGLAAEQLFARYQETEERPFLGDTAFYWYLQGLAPRVEQDERGIYRLYEDLAPAPRPRWLGGLFWAAGA